MNATVERAARKFFGEIVTGEMWDYTAHPAKPLILTAFAAYAESWRGTGFNIAGWEWPFTELKAGRCFSGDEPWSVLFRHAIALAGKRSKRR